MGKFNILGGNFEPNGYIKIDAGGSHDENPNGGVQIGVDPQGVPNMVEEDETIFKDYVFSDNIYADGGILQQFHLPKKYENMLYSDVADKILSELEQAPLDNIVNRGVNAMISRLAEAQEAQKQQQQEKELEEQLSQMSPEELSELEAILSQQEQTGEQEVVTQEAVEQPTKMAMGGQVNKFYAGGDEERDNKKSNKPRFFTSLFERDKNTLDAMEKRAKEIKAKDELSLAKNALFGASIPLFFARLKANNLERYSDLYPNELEKAKSRLDKRQARYDELSSKLDSLKALAGTQPVIVDSVEEVPNFNDEPQGTYHGHAAPAINYDTLGAQIDSMLTVNGRSHACGGPIHRYDGIYEPTGELRRPLNADAMRLLINGVTQPDLTMSGAVPGTYWGSRTNTTFDPAIDNQLLFDEMQDVFDSLPEEPLPGSQPHVLDAVVPGVQLTPFVVPGFPGPGGTDSIPARTAAGILSKPVTIAGAPNRSVAPMNDVQRNSWIQKMSETPDEEEPVSVTPDAYNTNLRTAGAWLAGAEALANLAQPIQELSIPELSTPSDYPRMRQQYARFTPVDVNRGIADVRQGTNALLRSIGASGSPSARQAMIAATNAGVQNEGAAFARDTTLNDNLYNSVLRQNNAADSALGQYGLSARQFSDQMRQRNEQLRAQFDLQRQLYKMQEDARLGQALSSNLGVIGNALAGIGHENFAFNQLNTNRALYDQLFPNGVSRYKNTDDENNARLGGTLLRRRK